jgi:hypothetical protein
MKPLGTFFIISTRPRWTLATKTPLRRGFLWRVLVHSGKRRLTKTGAYRRALWTNSARNGQGFQHQPAEGDRALAALLLAHSIVMNGGVVHTLGR